MTHSNFSLSDRGGRVGRISVGSTVRSFSDVTADAPPPDPDHQDPPDAKPEHSAPPKGQKPPSKPAAPPQHSAPAGGQGGGQPAPGASPPISPSNPYQPPTPQPTSAPITDDTLQNLSGFVSKLVQQAEGIDASKVGNAVARMLQDGSMSIKVPLGDVPQVSLDTLSEIQQDLSRNLFGYLKSLGLGAFGKVDNLCIQSGNRISHPGLAGSGFVVACTVHT